jgi:CheY-like chemotaxis protein
MVVATQVNDSVEHVKTQFLASLNHEIRTPLSGILGMTDLLLETQLDSEQKEYVSATRLCAESLLETLNATLEYSALSSGMPTIDEYEFTLAEALEMSVAEYIARARAKGLRLYLTYGDNLPETIIGDARRLRQMLAQLIANAVKFTNQGQVEVLAERDPDGKLKIAVRDTGIGIPQEKMAMIFDSFSQANAGLSRSHPGLGLGLALAQRIAGLCGGTIEVESRLEAGSTFIIRLPLKASIEGADYGAIASSSASGRKSILIVEDNEVSQTVVCHLLKRHGFDLHCASSGTEALQAAATQRFDLILMDLQMPDLDGLETTSLIRKLPGCDQIPILALTANYSDVYREMAKERGMQAFMSKPVKGADLIATINRFLK